MYSVWFEAVSWFRRLPGGHPQKFHVLPAAAAALASVLFLYSRWQHTGFCRFVCKPRCSTCVRIITAFHSDAFFCFFSELLLKGKARGIRCCLTNLTVFFFYLERAPPLDAEPQTGYFFKTKSHSKHCKRNPSHSNTCQARGSHLLLSSVRFTVGVGNCLGAQ